MFKGMIQIHWKRDKREAILVTHIKANLKFIENKRGPFEHQTKHLLDAFGS
jgi:hypothetical protein